MYRPLRLAAALGLVGATSFGLLLLDNGSSPVVRKATGQFAGNVAGNLEGKVSGKTSTEPVEDRAHVGKLWAQLPLRFEKNAGQADASAQYVVRGSGYSALLSGTEATYILEGPRQADPLARMHPLERLQQARQRAAERVALRMEIAGANPAPRAEPLEALETRSNYLIGNDSAQWHTNIPNYAKVRYHEVYPGVDLVYRGQQNQLEYDFVLAPGRDPSAIRLRFAGAG